MNCTRRTIAAARLLHRVGQHGQAHRSEPVQAAAPARLGWALRAFPVLALLLGAAHA